METKLRPVRIGGVLIDPPVVLAPMAGITTHPFRLLCKREGCGLVVTEVLSSNALVRDNPHTPEYLAFSEEERPLAMQLSGSDPAIMAEAARRLQQAGADLVDINAGCAVPKFVKVGAGCALMRRPRLLSAIIETVAGAVSIPVTVKIRKGWSDSEANAVAMTRLAEGAGASAVTVHGRTGLQQYHGVCDWDTLRQCKEAVRIPVLGSGDVRSPADAERMFRSTGVDAVMIGRAALGNPWVFSRVIAWLKEGKVLPPPTVEQRAVTLLLHARLLTETKPERLAICDIRKHVGWYMKGLPRASELREKTNRVTTYQELESLIRHFVTQVYARCGK